MLNGFKISIESIKIDETKNRTTIFPHVDQANDRTYRPISQARKSQMTGTAIKLGAELSPKA